VVGQRDAPTALPPGKEAGTHSARGWVVSRARTGSEVWKQIQNTNHKLTFRIRKESGVHDIWVISSTDVLLIAYHKLLLL
jgi:hypothetical protein